MRFYTLSLALFLGASALVGCGSSEEVFTFPTPEPNNFDPAAFGADSALITNPWLVYRVGRKTVLEAITEEGLERVEIEVLAETRTVNGIQCAIVRDRVSLDGVLVEDTFDWYAQDTQGNVWYMGEESKDYAPDGSLISTAGSWEAGLDIIGLGSIAEAGVQMFADPDVGKVYYQEFYPGEATDAAEIIDLESPVLLSDGTTYTALKIKEWNPREPGGFEYKYYVNNVGLVLETDEDGEEPLELMSQQD